MLPGFLKDRCVIPSNQCRVNLFNVEEDITREYVFEMVSQDVIEHNICELGRLFIAEYSVKNEGFVLAFHLVRLHMIVVN